MLHHKKSYLDRFAEDYLQTKFLGNPKPLPYMRLVYEENITQIEKNILLLGRKHVASAIWIYNKLQRHILYAETDRSVVDSEFIREFGATKLDTILFSSLINYDDLASKYRTVYIIGSIHDLLSKKSFNSLMDSISLTGGIHKIVILDYFIQNTKLEPKSLAHIKSVLNHNQIYTGQALRAFFKVYNFDFVQGVDLSTELYDYALSRLTGLSNIPSRPYRTMNSPKLLAAAIYGLFRYLRNKDLFVSQYEFTKVDVEPILKNPTLTHT